MRKLAFAILLTFALSACASSKSASKSDGSTVGVGIDIETMRPPEASQVLQEFRAKYGFEPPLAEDPNIESMAQVLEIIRGDRIREYDAARRYAAGKKGPEALTIRAYLELSLAEAMRTAAAILDEQRKQDELELRQLEQPRSFGNDADTTKANAEQAAALRTETSDFRKAVRALRVLSEEPLQAGAELAAQAVQQDPDIQLGYLANAMYFRLRRDWLEFDRMMKYADDTDADPPVRAYLRGMEAFERYVDRHRAKRLLSEALAANPGLVRAQANLVLVETDIEQKYAALQKLRSMNPNHLVVALAGREIESEHETALELRSALAPQ